jgi:transcriptional regulator with XRE-family HTH domain
MLTDLFASAYYRPTMRNLREYRRRAGLTQMQLSERSGIHQTNISKMELGRISRPAYATVRRLADALDLSPDVLADTPVPAPVVTA